MLDPAFDLLTASLKAFKRQVDKLNKEKHTLFNDISIVMYHDYLQKLFIYHNNFIQFSEPKVLLESIDHNIEKFSGVFFPKVKMEAINLVQDKFKTLLDINLKSKLINQVHTDVEIDTTIIPSIYFNFELDALGKNGSLYLVNYLDFCNSIQTID